MYLVYVPIAVLFAVFVIYAGLVMPVREVSESLHDRREPRGPDAPDKHAPDKHAPEKAASADDAEVLAFRSASGDDRRAAA
ncbi:hypothetical protein GCM10010411_36220 [Actinomadura fulvescens]|uniref:Uncharacterized protein n=2 Tax=Actinomadura fulvescens TaxID=46160 RepID=A0ABP6C407_9ACTN